MTLIELVVVVVIVGIAGALAAPAVWRAVEPDAIGRVAAELDRLLETAHRRAVERGVTVTLTIVPETGRYWISGEQATSAPESTGVLPRPGGVDLTGPARARFTFGADGSVAGDSLRLAGEGAHAWVAFDPLTGDARVFRP